MTRSLRRPALPALFALTTLHAAIACAQEASGAGDASAASADPDATQLPKVMVTANADASAGGLKAPYAGGQVAKGGRFGLLGNLDLFDAPFNALFFTQQTIADQQARSVADVLQNDPGVRVARGFGNYQELYVIRGFAVYSDDVAYNGLYGLLPRQYISTEMIERVEVFRGANSFLNGAAPGGSNVGGAINLVPKRAPNYALTDVTTGIEDGGQVYASVDVARRFVDGRLGVRADVARRSGDTAIDHEKQKLEVASLGVDYRGDTYRVSADVGYQNDELRGGRPSVTPGAGLAIPTPPDATLNYGQPWTHSYERDFFGTVRGELDVTKDVTAYVAAGLRHSTESNVLANPTLTSSDGALSSYRFDNQRKDDVSTGEVGIRATADTGPVRHRLSLAASTFTLRSNNAYAFSDFGGFATQLYSRVDAAPPAATFFTGGDLDDPRLTHKSELDSVALADSMSAFDDRIGVTAGVRRQRIKDYGYDYDTNVLNATYREYATTPLGGLVFKPIKQVALYANYAEALVQGPVAGGTAVNVGQVFAPYRSRQKEVGVKLDEGTIGGTFAAFTTAQPQGVLDPTTRVFSIDGKSRNRGLELTVYGEPVKGVRVLGGATLLDARQVSTDSGATDGRRTIGVPALQSNVGIELDVPWVPGLVLTGRGVQNGRVYADAANTQTVQPWTRYDVGARYRTMVMNRPVALVGRIDNVTDRSYWASSGGAAGAGYLVLGAPRSYSLTASIEF